MQTWVVKLSKFCNMRCSYCYEWNELSDPKRMSVDTWQNVLKAAISYNSLQAARFGSGYAPYTLIVLHGGEPLALPTPYLRTILAIFRDTTRGAPGHYQLAVQSNLYSVHEEKLQLLLNYGASLSFSYDVIPGPRRSLLGKPSEAIVSQNVDRIRARGIPLSGIAVLAKHTAEQITAVYDFYAERRLTMRILPLFDGPPERPTDDITIDHPTMVAALERLFRHWMETGCRIQISPFDLHFQSALRHMAGLHIRQWERRVDGDGVLLINVDGRVYRVADAYEQELALGDLSTQTLDEVLSSGAYQSSLELDHRAFDRHCASCAYRTACTGGFIYDARVSTPYDGNCVTAYHCIAFMQRFVREQGYGEADIRKLLTLIRQNQQEPTRVTASL